MADIFDIDTKDQKQLLKFFKKFPKQAKYATAGVLNNFAFGARKETIKNYQLQSIIRSPGFLNAVTRVQKAKGSQDVNSQYSVIYFQEKKNFTAFAEQELGMKTKRKKTISINARGGDKSGKVRKRFKTGQSMDTPESTGLSSNIGGFLAHQKSQRNKAFLLTRKYKGLSKGVYTYKGSGNSKQLLKLQHIGKTVQPKHRPIMYPSAQLYVKRLDMNGLWSKEMTRQLERMVEYRELRY